LWEIVSPSPEHTETIGEELGRQLAPGDVVSLVGELGAGKTVFVRGVARGLLAGEERVTSPTYVLLHVHRGQKTTLYHMDAYRLRSGIEDFGGAGLSECLADPFGVVCLEWAERVSAALPDDRVEVEIEHRGEQERSFRMGATGPRAARVLAQLSPTLALDSGEVF